MLKTIMPLNAIVALRFFGLFIVLPVMSVYAMEMQGSNELLIGLAIGAYAATQMFLQVPFGMLSDKIGRKITLVIGLVIFIIGSLVCAYADEIYMLILGRLLQGAGAIGAVATAMISDMIKEEIRAKAMAIMGASVAMAFALSMVLGPILGAYWGIDKLFALTAFFALVSIILLYTKVPNPPKISHDYGKTDKKQLLTLLKDKNLMRMNITNMLQKGMMTLAFLVIPILMLRDFDYVKQDLWQVYVPAMIFGIFAMGASAVFGEKKKKPKEVLIAGILLFGAAFAIMGWADSSWIFILGVVVFFMGFNIHEPLLQSLASKYAKINQKGTALGIFNTFGYFGTFTGSLWGGHILKWYGIEYVSWVVILTCILWVWVIYTLKNPVFSKNIYVPFNDVIDANLEKLNGAKGIIEWYKNENEQTLIIKYSSQNTDKDEIMALIR